MTTEEFEEKLKALVKEYAESGDNGLPTLGFMSFKGCVRVSEIKGVAYYCQIGVI